MPSFANNVERRDNKYTPLENHIQSKRHTCGAPTGSVNEIPFTADQISEHLMYYMIRNIPEDEGYILMKKICLMFELCILFLCN